MSFSMLQIETLDVLSSALTFDLERMRSKRKNISKDTDVSRQTWSFVNENCAAFEVILLKLPNLTNSRPNLLHQHLSFLICCLVKNNIIPAVECLKFNDDADEDLKIAASTFFHEFVGLARKILPKEHFEKFKLAIEKVHEEEKNKNEKE